MKLFTLIGLLSANVFASGWDCYGSGYHTIIRNSTTETRTPVVFVLSKKGEGSIIEQKGNSDITKETQSDGVSYGAFGPGEQMYAEQFISHREGADKPLKDGDKVGGKLVITTQEDEKNPTKISTNCYRYLKDKE